MTKIQGTDDGGGLRERTEEHAQSASEPLPCLSSNKCNENPAKASRLHALTSQHRKTAVALCLNVAALADRYGVEHLGFLTLTFADHVTDPKEAQRRLKSLRTGELADRYVGFVRVFERQKSGRIHFHLLVVLDADIRTGSDFTAFAQRDYRTANARLRAEWAFWRSTAKAYGFGRTELMPIRSTHEGIARYVGKYISKHIGQREERDKGVRLAEYSRGARIANTRFSWASAGARQWRLKLRLFAQTLFHTGRIPSPTFQGLRAGLGPKWAYHWKDLILSLPDVEDPNATAKDRRSSVRVVPAPICGASDRGIELDQRTHESMERRGGKEGLGVNGTSDRSWAPSGDEPGQRDIRLPNGMDFERQFYDFAQRRIVRSSELPASRVLSRLASIRYAEENERER